MLLLSATHQSQKVLIRVNVIATTLEVHNVLLFAAKSFNSNVIGKHTKSPCT